MISTDALWLDAMRRDGADIRWMVEIATTATQTFRFVTGDTSLFGYPAAVEAVTPVEAEIDPFTLARTTGSVEIAFRPGFLEPIELSDQPEDQGLIGKRVRLWLGEALVPEAVWALRFVGLTQDFRIEPSGIISLTVGDFMDVALNQLVVGVWIARHPAAVLASVVATLPSDLVATASFTGDTDTVRSHWSLSRATNTLVAENNAARIESFPLADQQFYSAFAEHALSVTQYFADLCVLLGGTVRTDADGKLAFTRYSTPTAAVRHISADEMTAPSYRSMADNIANPLKVGFFSRNPDTWEDLGVVVPADPDALEPRAYFKSHVSQAAAQSWQGIAASRERTIDAPWINAATIMPSITATAGGINSSQTDVRLEDASYAGFSGMRWRNGFKWATYASFTTLTGILTITSVSLGTGSADFVVGNEISYWDGTITRHATIYSYSAGTIAANTTAPDGNAPPGGEQAFFYLAQNELDRITATRRVWIEVAQGTDEGIERMEVTAIRPSRTVSISTYDCNMGIYTEHNITEPKALQLTVIRAQLGTSAASWANTATFYDITIPVDVSTDREGRFLFGAPVAEAQIDLCHADLQEMDVISFDDPAFFYRRVKTSQGADSTVLWQIIKIGTDVADARAIDVVLAYAGRTS